MKVFIEEQRFNQWWLYIILAIPFLALLFPFLFQQEKVNNDKETIYGIFISLLVMIIVVGLVLSIRLKTRIDEKGVHYRFFPFPFLNRLIKWSEIEKVYVRKYNPITEYGGWE